MLPRCSGPDRTRTAGPHRGQREREPVEAGFPGPAGQRNTEQHSADHQSRDDRSLSAPRHRRRLLIRSGDVGDHRGDLRRVTRSCRLHLRASVRISHVQSRYAARPQRVWERPTAGPAPAARRDGSDWAASRRMRSASPPAHAASVSARWCGSASRSTGRGLPDPTASARSRLDPGQTAGRVRAPGRDSRRSDAVIGKSSDATRSVARPSGIGSTEPAEPGEYRQVHSRARAVRPAGCGSPARRRTQQPTVGRSSRDR